ncbi:MAG: ATP-binding cassette domain-containing protein [Kiritimatiellae bacterium]|nr:ATP-binding cassette domain-containing protein [Kiritimatiellia bacterium]
MSEQPVLEMKQVTVAGASANVTALTDVSVVLMPGGLLVLEPERHVDTVSFYDVASGLISPDDGVVCFCGEDWQRMGLFSQSAARGRVGRIFEVEGWVSNLSMFENIALSQRHHTMRSDRKLRKAIGALLERIGLRDCLADRPHVLSRGELRRAQWVRAFLGEAALLLLNAPLLDVRPEDQPVLIDLVREARARGAAVVWKSCDAAPWSGREGFEDAVHGTLSVGRLQMSNPC